MSPSKKITNLVSSWVHSVFATYLNVIKFRLAISWKIIFNYWNINLFYTIFSRSIVQKRHINRPKMSAFIIFHDWSLQY